MKIFFHVFVVLVGFAPAAAAAAAVLLLLLSFPLILIINIVVIFQVHIHFHSRFIPYVCFFILMAHAQHVSYLPLSCLASKSFKVLESAFQLMHTKLV